MAAQQGYNGPYPSGFACRLSGGSGGGNVRAAIKAAFSLWRLLSANAVPGIFPFNAVWIYYSKKINPLYCQIQFYNIGLMDKIVGEIVFLIPRQLEEIICKTDRLFYVFNMRKNAFSPVFEY